MSVRRRDLGILAGVFFFDRKNDFFPVTDGDFLPFQVDGTIVWFFFFFRWFFHH